jgi:hypothetical protein
VLVRSAIGSLGKKDPPLQSLSPKKAQTRSGSSIALEYPGNHAMHEATVSEIARAILDHLRKNPEAQDTVDGILHWWLPSQEIEPRIATISDALHVLMAAGLVTEFVGKDTQISYRMTNRELRNPEGA